MNSDIPASVLDYVELVHRTVDELVAPLVTAHRARLVCHRGCSGCCTDDLSVFEVEAAVIQRNHRALLAADAPAPPGRCAFLDHAGACRIYQDRPYVCRTQGLPLRWAEELEDQVVERRDICSLNEIEGSPIEDLPADEVWTLGPIERRLAAAQARVDGGEGRRVLLRALFGAG
jgi:hypothetical protein